jgi:hypothetical protein
MPTAPAQPRSSIAAAIWTAAGEAMAAARVRARPDDELTEARELLAYWEDRVRGLPRWALMRRREARAAADRWRARVAEAERERYGRGMLGAVSQYALERRAPAALAHRGRRAVRVTAYVAAVAAMTLVVAFAALVAAVATVVASAL